MQKYFEKIKEKLEEEVKYQRSKADEAGKTYAFEEIPVVKAREKMAECYEHAIEIVNQVAEEVAVAENATTNDGWISCSERLPETDGKYIVCTTKGSVYCTKYHSRGKIFGTDMNTHIEAWQPLPTPYQPKGEEANRV